MPESSKLSDGYRGIQRLLLACSFKRSRWKAAAKDSLAPYGDATLGPVLVVQQQWVEEEEDPVTLIYISALITDRKTYEAKVTDSR